MIRYLTLALIIGGRLGAQTACESLTKLRLQNATITLAESVPAGLFQPPGTPAPTPVVLPAHCRVTAVLTPSSDSHIEMELWLPSENWNGKFEAAGNGGWAGSISFGSGAPTSNAHGMADALRENYATVSTDTGHRGSGNDASWALGHPEKLEDFAWRAVHETVVKSKSIIKAFYGRSPSLSYWNGCSTGGRQGLMEAQRFPEDFDAILAGAPANYQMHLNAWDMNFALVNQKDNDHLVPPRKLALVNKAVLEACDALDGVRDGLLTDPRKCHFDPGTLLCAGADASDCLTKAQIESIRAAYSPARTRSGKVIFPGLARGGETGLIRMSAPEPFPIALNAFRYVAHGDPNWDWRTFDLERDVELIDKKAGFINAINPDLSAFKARHGKLLIYHGWNDQLISPQNSIDYYSSVLEKMGKNQDDWLRLFMAPGMMHCGSGPGPNQFNGMAVLERWRESAIPPAQITAMHATNGFIDMTRPLCPYPSVAIYRGTGSTNDAANFACRAQ